MTRFEASRQTLNPIGVDAPDLMAFIEGKAPRAIGDWRDLGAAEHARAFAMAQTAGYDVVADVYAAMVEIFRTEGTEADFAAAVMPLLERKGWVRALGGQRQAQNRLDLVFQMQVRTAQGAGQWQRYQRNKAAFPYLRGFTAGDERVRHPPKSPLSDHRAWDGLILPVDHPFWTRWWPPFGFRCRCQVVQMTRSQLARYAGGITSEAELAARERRLGTPIFDTPAAGIARQVQGMVDATNDRRLEGAEPLDAQRIRGSASTVWDAIRAQMSARAVEELVAQLFGQAA